MSTAVNEICYGISVLDSSANVLVEQNGLALFETMSGIKSILGTLAIDTALANGCDLDQTELFVADRHNSNGYSELKKRLRKEDDKFTLPLRSILQRNITDSDCVATNVLIDYLGTKEDVNSRIKHELGIAGIELVTNRIYFNGVDHQRVPYQVGKGTMRDFAKYYQTLWANDERVASAEHTWHKQQHREVKTARLFGVQTSELPATVQWTHKTGSGDDVKPGKLYSTMMDAGELRVGDRTLYVAAALTLHHEGEDMPSRQQIMREFALRNASALPT